MKPNFIHNSPRYGEHAERHQRIPTAAKVPACCVTARISKPCGTPDISQAPKSSAEDISSREDLPHPKYQTPLPYCAGHGRKL